MKKTSNSRQRIYCDLFWQIPEFEIRVFSAFYTQNKVLIIAQVNKEKSYENHFNVFLVIITNDAHARRSRSVENWRSAIINLPITTD